MFFKFRHYYIPLVCRNETPLALRLIENNIDVTTKAQYIKEFICASVKQMSAIKASHRMSATECFVYVALPSGGVAAMMDNCAGSLNIRAQYCNDKGDSLKCICVPIQHCAMTVFLSYNGFHR